MTKSWKSSTSYSTGRPGGAQHVHAAVALGCLPEVGASGVLTGWLRLRGSVLAWESGYVLLGAAKVLALLWLGAFGGLHRPGGLPQRCTATDPSRWALAMAPGRRDAYRCYRTVLALCGGIAEYSVALLSVHVAQLMTLLLVVPAVVALSEPVALWQQLHGRAPKAYLRRRPLLFAAAYVKGWRRPSSAVTRRGRRTR